MDLGYNQSIYCGLVADNSYWKSTWSIVRETSWRGSWVYTIDSWVVCECWIWMFEKRPFNSTGYQFNRRSRRSITVVLRNRAQDFLAKIPVSPPFPVFLGSLERSRSPIDEFLIFVPLEPELGPENGRERRGIAPQNVWEITMGRLA